jgi:hypothetical protein
MRSKYDHADRGATAEEEELETGEPIPGEADTPPPGKKIPARNGGFAGRAPDRTEPSETGGGQMVLSSAKYLKNNPDDQGHRKGSKMGTGKEQSSGHGGTFGFEMNLLNGGVGGGLLAMIGAAVWFVIGLANDILFFYPPILFFIGLFAFMKGLAGNKE